MLACDAPTPIRRAGRVLPPTRPNLGIRKGYHVKLDRLVKEMHDSVLYWLSVAYRQNTPEMATDASPAIELRRAFRKLATRWTRRINQAAPKLADYFATAVKDRTDAHLKTILKDAGMTVAFKMTPQVNDAYQGVIGEQVGLIKSIASRYLSDVETSVMRSVQAGRKLGELTDELQEKYGLSRSRAALIARDQNNKATATITRARQMGMGLTQAEWVHSRGGNHPRPEHVAADGKRYDIAKGMYLEGKWVWPGTEINCRCVSRTVIPELDG